MAEQEPKTIEELEIDRKHFIDRFISPEVRNDIVLCAFERVDRMDFVPEHAFDAAYTDEIIPLSEGSSISQPSLVAKMLDFAGLDGTGKVLEIGTASGYNAAVMSLCAEEVHTIEYDTALAKDSAWLLDRLGYKNVHVHAGDGLGGVPENGPFKAIVVTAAVNEIPLTLVHQMAPNSRMVIPIGSDDPGEAVLCLLSMSEDEKLSSRPIGFVGFVPIMSSYPGGWSHEEMLEVRERREVAQVKPIIRIAMKHEMTLDEYRQAIRYQYDIDDTVSDDQVDAIIRVDDYVSFLKESIRSLAS